MGRNIKVMGGNLIIYVISCKVKSVPDCSRILKWQIFTRISDWFLSIHRPHPARPTDEAAE
jgi:hypothetical protein